MNFLFVLVLVSIFEYFASAVLCRSKGVELSIYLVDLLSIARVPVTCTQPVALL